MNRETLEQIAEELDGKDIGLQGILDSMGNTTPAREVERELEQMLSFGYCQTCMLWGDEWCFDGCPRCVEA